MYLLFVSKVSKDQKDIMNTRKKQVQDDIRKALGILVDAPAQGSGNTNDGNTARTFFNNVDTIADIPGTIIILLQMLCY